MSVATAADPTPVVIGMMGSAPACANCFMGCASKTGEEKTACGSACGPAASSAPPPAPPPVTAPPAAPGDAPSGSGADSSAPRDTAPVLAPAPPSASECSDSSDDVVNAASGGLLPNCAAGKALCAVDPRIPAGCPLTCGVCKPECKDSPDDVVNAASGAHPSASIRFRDWQWMDVLVRCTQVGCSPTALPARRCAAQTHEFPPAAQRRAVCAPMGRRGRR